jgi:hypothetical protein
VIVRDLDLVGIAASPDEADPPLIIDTDTMLAAASTLQCLKPIAGRNAQVSSEVAESSTVSFT